MADTAEIDKWVKQAKEAIDQIAHIAAEREAHAKELEAKLVDQPSEDDLAKLELVKNVSKEKLVQIMDCFS